MVQCCKLLWEVALRQSLKGEGELLRQSRKKTITLNRHSLEVLIGRNEAPIKYIWHLFPGESCYIWKQEGWGYGLDPEELKGKQETKQSNEVCDLGTVLAHDQALYLGNSQEVTNGELAYRLGQTVKAMINCYRSTCCLLSDRLVSLAMKKGYRKVYSANIRF